jgi:hypothetical protein
MDVFFNFGGGRCRTCQQYLPGDPPSTTSVVTAVRPTGNTPRGPPLMSSSTLVVATAGPSGSASQGSHHRRLLQLQCWPLSDLPAATPRGPTINIFFNFGGGHCRTYR